MSNINTVGHHSYTPLDNKDLPVFTRKADEEIKKLVAENQKLKSALLFQEKRADRKELLALHWKDEVDRHAETFNRMGRAMDKINKMVRRGFVNLGDELNYEIKEIMETDK